MKKGDRVMALICAVLFLVSTAFYVYRRTAAVPERKMAVVSVNGKVIDILSVNAAGKPYERSYRTDGGVNVVRVEGGAVSVVSADCPDHDCVRRGRLLRPGDTSACLPHRFLIRVAGEGGADMLDGGTY